MPFQGKQDVVPIHPLAVVKHPNQPRAAALDLDRYVLRPGIQAVLHKFLDHRSRPLDHFPGGYLVGKMFGKNTDCRHVLSRSEKRNIEY
jgi:hypothetical protein